MTEYLKRDIARILKKRSASIEYYTSTELVIPDIEPAQGRGKPRVYSERNLIEFGMIEIASRMRISLSTIGLFLNTLRSGKFIPEGFTEILLTKSTTEASDWLKNKKVFFNDFWTSDEWGVTKELVFMDVRGLSESGEVAYEQWVEVVEKIEKATGLPLNRIFDPAASVASILWLGSIKRAAQKLVLE